MAIHFNALPQTIKRIEVCQVCIQNCMLKFKMRIVAVSVNIKRETESPIVTKLFILLEKLTLLHANNKSVDQPEHLHSLISAFAVHFLQSIKTSLDTCKISIF